ncbi:MAG: ABC transporter substrate-binding protein [Christensenellales bacterium]|jgi:iron complex transport system substrate-binding protein
MNVCRLFCAICLLCALCFPASAEPYAFVDDLGNQITVPCPPSKAVALHGSFAEAYLLAGGSLIGVTEDAASERGLDLPDGTQIIGTLHMPNLELILNLEPDFVILSSDMESHIEIGRALREMGIPAAFYSVNHYTEYMDMMAQFTAIADHPERFAEQIEQIQAPIEATIARAKAQPAYWQHTALFIRAFSTGAKAKGSDSLGGAILKDMGLVNIADGENTVLEDISIEEIIARDPDYIFAVPMGVEPAKAMDALAERLIDNPAWGGLTAVREGRYHVLPKELFHLKPNADWGDAYELLEEILYP